MQDKDFEWFVQNYKDIYEKYGDTYVAIKNQNILGSYPTYAEGVRETSKTEPLGGFIVQYCNGDVSGYTGYITSMPFRQVQ